MRKLPLVLAIVALPPITGPEAIKQFWESQIKLGVRDHTFDIIETGADGKYAYQVTKNTVQLVRDTGERTSTCAEFVSAARPAAPACADGTGSSRRIRG